MINRKEIFNDHFSIDLNVILMVFSHFYRKSIGYLAKFTNPYLYVRSKMKQQQSGVKSWTVKSKLYWFTNWKWCTRTIGQYQTKRYDSSYITFGMSVSRCHTDTAPSASFCVKKFCRLSNGHRDCDEVSFFEIFRWKVAVGSISLKFQTIVSFLFDSKNKTVYRNWLFFLNSLWVENNLINFAKYKFQYILQNTHTNITTIMHWPFRKKVQRKTKHEACKLLKPEVTEPLLALVYIPINYSGLFYFGIIVNLIMNFISTEFLHTILSIFRNFIPFHLMENETKIIQFNKLKLKRNS